MQENYKKSGESLNKVVDDDCKRLGETIKICCEETKKSVKKIRGKLRNDNNSGTDERPENEDLEPNNLQMNDNQMEVKGLPKDNNTEQVGPKTEDNGIKKKIIKKTKGKKMKIRRIIRPKKKENHQEQMDRIVEGYTQEIKELRKKRNQSTEKPNQKTDCLLYTSRCV